MEQYLIDTNIVSDYFSASLPVAGMDFMDAVINDIPHLSIITQIELLCWSTDINTTQNVKQFISDSIVFDISPDIIEHCVNIRKYKKVKTPDAIIAATALSYDLTLITRNNSDFKNISGLKLTDPHSL